MKAYKVKDLVNGNIAIVFAENGSKAKSYAFTYTDYFEDNDYCELIAYRVPTIDKYYQKGKKSMDWQNQDDRLVVVKELGISCSYDTYDIIECKKYKAKNYCDTYVEKVDDEIYGEYRNDKL